MKLLLSADWQSDWDNLDLCETAAKQVLQICRDYELDGFVIAGDLKKAYNPIDSRMVQFWMDFIHKATSVPMNNDDKRLKVVLVLGNHDRVGMYSEAQNWLPILERAGAIVVHNKPKRVSIRSGCLYCLPFSSSVEQTRDWAKQLSESVPSDETSSILIFHNDILGCSYNVLGHKSEARLKPSDLYPQAYDACFGGHVHLRQSIPCKSENLYYLGNPFCTDWGEANQQKGYTLLIRDTQKFIPSVMPGWYDPAWPKFPKGERDWEGARIRIHVPIEVGENYSQVLESAKKEAEKKYAHAHIYAVPEFEQNEAPDSKVKLSDTDAVKVKTYVDETIPDSLLRHRDAVVSYLTYKLAKASEGLGIRTGGRIEFLSAKAKNFLSFEELELDFTKPGLYLIVGKNQDWLGRSNGCIAEGTFIDCPRDLGRHPFGIPIEDLVGTQPFVYAYSSKEGRIVLRKAAWVKKTGEARPVVKIRFRAPFGDPSLVVRRNYRPQKKRGRKIKPFTELVVTPDHSIMMRDGTYKAARDLLPGDSIMPLYRRCVGGDYFALNLNNGESVLENRFVLSELIGARDLSWHAHHKDLRRCNNEPTNLQWKTEHEHLADHASERNYAGTFGWQGCGGEHPRGMLGKEHTNAVRKQIARTVGKTWNNKEVRARRMAGYKRLTRESLRKAGLLDKRSALYELVVLRGLSLRKTGRRLGVPWWKIQQALRYFGIENHKVVSVELCGKSSVYDINVPGINNFVANSVVVHNSGKTNALQTIPVALEGVTFKGQKHDSWAFDKSKKPATVELRFRDARDRIAKVERGRRPGILRLFIDGKEHSSGLQSTAQAGTQGLIEKLSGFTWQTLANAVYIDQEQVNMFLSGTPGEQKLILERFQNLERFAKALKEILKEVHFKSVALEDAANEKAIADAKAKTYRDTMDQEQPGDTRYEDAKKLVEVARVAYEKACAKDVAALKKQLITREAQEVELAAGEKSLQKQLFELNGQYEFYKIRLRDIHKAVGKSVCPTCQQAVNEQNLQEHIYEWEVKLQRIEKQRTSVEGAWDVAVAALRQCRSLQHTLNRQIADYEQTRQTMLSNLKHREENAASMKQYHVEALGRKQELQRQMATASRNAKFWVKQIDILTEEKAIVDYCAQAFSRNGVPAFLNAQMCPLFNRAAEHYSEVFTDKEIQVRVKMQDAEFQVEVINAHGGQTMLAQSMGEKKMAGIIGSFALRSIAPPCNLLVLDEPGDGLDAVNAKAFAVGLKKLKNQLGTVLLTSHNPTIVGELSGESCIIVSKRDGVSSIVD